ncbi:MAG: DNA polymerase III subunit epsilon [Buchnera aphidicola (Chaetogeoica yunlongensis)]
MKKCDRKIALDTETTGMNHTGVFYENHKIIEIGAVEIINNDFTGNDFHCYIQPNRPIDKDSFKVHGISEKFLLKKPEFRDIAENFLNYINNSTLIIHNAKFDVDFINYELSMTDLDSKNLLNFCNVIDTLSLARQLFPGKKNSLDALCSRYKISIKHRTVHSALVDAKLLAKVYIFMTNIQKSILIFDRENSSSINKKNVNDSSQLFFKSRLLLATKQEIYKHNEFLKFIKNKTGKCLWLDK